MYTVFVETKTGLIHETHACIRNRRPVQLDSAEAARTYAVKMQTLLDEQLSKFPIDMPAAVYFFAPADADVQIGSTGMRSQADEWNRKYLQKS